MCHAATVADLRSIRSAGHRGRAIVETLTSRGQSLATAESLTGGRLAARLTVVPGASACFVGGVVAYATAVKVAAGGAARPGRSEYGVVSAECATAMARGCGGLGATWALATTGVAGPDQQEGKPVGTSGSRSPVPGG